MKKQQKTPASGAQYAGTPPVQHSEVVLAQQEEESKKTAAEKTRLLNEDDIEADRHNGSGGAFEATEREWNDE